MSASEGSVATLEAAGVRLVVVFFLALGAAFFLAVLRAPFVAALAPLRDALPAEAVLESGSPARVSTTSDSFLVFLGTVRWDC